MRTFWIAGIVGLSLGSLLWLWMVSRVSSELPSGLSAAAVAEPGDAAPAAMRTGADAGAPVAATSDQPRALDEATVRTPVPSAASRIVGTLIGVDGAAVRQGATLGATIEGPTGSGFETQAKVRLGEGGAFAIEVDVDLPAGSNVQFAERGPHGQRAGAAVVLHAPLARASEVDVGLVALQGWFRIAWGRVVDDLGAPIGEAVVIASAEAEDDGTSESEGAEFKTILTVGTFHVIPSHEVSRRATILPGEAIQLGGPTRRIRRHLSTEMVPGRVLHQTGVPIQLRLREQSWFASSARDGSFEIFAPTAPARPVSIEAIADGHQNGGRVPIALGGHVEIVLARASRLEGSVILPEWMPATAVQFALVGAGGDELTPTSVWTLPAEAGQPIVVGFAFDSLDADSYALLVRATHVPLPLAEIRDLQVAAGADERPPLVQRVDLRHRIHRYELHAIDERGARLLDLESPLLVRFGPPGDEADVRGFPWLAGCVELFHPSPSLDVTQVAAGYRVETVRVTPGPTELRFVALHPVELYLPGLRAECGPTRKVRISTVLRGSSGLPQGLTAIDQRSGESRGYQRWHLAQSGGAWLGDSDVVRVPLVRNGSYEVIVRLNGEGVEGERSVSCGAHEFALDGLAPQRLVIQVEADAIRAAIAQLDAAPR